MIRCANLGLKNLGPIALADAVSLSTVANQTEYPSQIAWQRTPPLRIDIATRTGATDHGWTEISRALWEYIPSTPNTQGLIVFKEHIKYPNLLRVIYNGIHPELKIGTDMVSETIPETLAKLAGVREALVWQNGRQQGGDPYLLQRQNQAETDQQNAMSGMTPWKIKRKKKLLVVPNR